VKDQERLLSPEELANHLGVYRSWIYRQTRRTEEKAIPRVKVGKYLRFKLSDVEEWLGNAHTQR